MPANQLIVVSLPGSGTPLLSRLTRALGYASYGTMSGDPAAEAERPGPGEVHPLLAAAYGADRAAALLRRTSGGVDAALEPAFQQAVSAVWRVWWTRLGQPTTPVSRVDPGIEARLAGLPVGDLLDLLPGRGCWYVTGLDLRRADAELIRTWHAGGRPPLVVHHRDLRDRIVSQIRFLTGPAERVGTLPEHLVYREILTALPTLDARITLALTDPGFPGIPEARSSQWLLRHPAVCSLSHEELTGPASARDQARARLLGALGHPGPPPLPAPRPADDDPTGIAPGRGRDLFSDAHEQLLHRHHSDLTSFQYR